MRHHSSGKESLRTSRKPSRTIPSSASSSQSGANDCDSAAFDSNLVINPEIATDDSRSMFPVAEHQLSACRPRGIAETLNLETVADNSTLQHGRFTPDFLVSGEPGFLHQYLIYSRDILRTRTIFASSFVATMWSARYNSKDKNCS